MADAPEVKPYDELRIGCRRAVVCTIHGRSLVEVVYLDDRNRAINEAAIWRGDGWDFEHSGPTGGYADNYDRLSVFVAQLRRPHA